MLVINSCYIARFRDGKLLAFFCIGALTAFFDFFNTPLLTWAFPLLALSLAERENFDSLGLVKTFKVLLILSLAWLLGYAGLWMSKWIVATLITGDNVLEAAISHIFLWTGADGTAAHEVPAAASRFSGLIANVAQFLPYRFERLCFAALIIISCITTVIVSIKDRHRAPIVSLWVLICVGLMPFLWFLVVNAHSALHCWFTFRLFFITVFAFGALWWMLAPRIRLAILSFRKK